MEKYIRNAKPKDIEIIAEYNIKMALETENKYLDKEIIIAGVSSIINDSSKGMYWVMEMNKIIIGQLMVTYEWSDWRNGMMWWIQSVYVPKEQRRQGVYSQMYNNLLELAQLDSECCGIRLYVEKENKKAQKTYKKLGMKNAGYEIMEFNKN
jgi:ribosomal protein S18 acetylase RimI-like enzyme